MSLVRLEPDWRPFYRTLRARLTESVSPLGTRQWQSLYGRCVAGSGTGSKAPARHMKFDASIGIYVYVWPYGT